MLGFLVRNNAILSLTIIDEMLSKMRIPKTIEISLAKKFVNFVIEIPPIKTINPYIKGYQLIIILLFLRKAKIKKCCCNFYQDN